MRTWHKTFVAATALIDCLRTMQRSEFCSRFALALCPVLVGALLLWFGLARFTPVVVTVTPPDAADGVYPDASLAVSFSQPMSAETVNGRTLTLRDSDGTFIPADISYDAKHRIARVAPKSPLRAGVSYELMVGEDPELRPVSALRLPLAEARKARFKIAQAPESTEGVRAPILIVTDESTPQGAYYGEILRAEGFNLFSVVDLNRLTPEQLVLADIVILAVVSVSGGMAARLEEWVRAGGNLITMAPTGELLPLLGLADAGPPVPNGYLLADAESKSSRGITRETLQIHVPASRFILRDGISVAHLFETATRPLASPAISLRKLGRGHAAAFAYDLARSIIRTRQGNPEWINQERDGLPPRRTNDLFYPDHLDMTKVGIPQADEQQRLLANLILVMNGERRPLPRFWYLPSGRRAAIIMAGDDHATKRGTITAFEKLKAESPPGCRLDAWECYRATSYVDVGTRVTPARVKQFTTAGFEVGIHTETGCKDQDNTWVGLALSQQVNDYGTRRLGIEKQQTHRMHCVIWNGWVDTAKSERAHGIRLSLNYYYWPGSWVLGRPGFMTGSGFPMRFADTDGTALDIYHATTHMVNENGINHASGVRFLIDRALGPEQFFGAFGTHYDYTDRFFDTLLSVAKETGVALVSAEQMLRWLEGRDSSRFDQIAWSDHTLTFRVEVAAGAESIVAMLPRSTSGMGMASIECDDKPVSYRLETIKGLEYALFPVRSGNCRAIYQDGVPPHDGVSGVQPTTRVQ
ncbi:Ig-like domain-containing protein [Microvirga alba]|uniref:Ig-like domain-containing protein n=1 Tax=Microvirga alba TaxID=2791025 RepID=A0A931FPE0_9HYPH|nr:Ig-like domain-containing protein [Microvirga alba]MBF9232328.1 Ig-like domain-containing protein [Microvirga alba]